MEDRIEAARDVLREFELGAEWDEAAEDGIPGRARQSQARAHRRLSARGPRVIATIHRGRPRSVDIQVEAEIVFVMRWRDRLLTHWSMFMTVDEAVAAAQTG